MNEKKNQQNFISSFPIISKKQWEMDCKNKNLDLEKCQTLTPDLLVKKPLYSQTDQCKIPLPYDKIPQKTQVLAQVPGINAQWDLIKIKSDLENQLKHFIFIPNQQQTNQCPFHEETLKTLINHENKIHLHIKAGLNTITLAKKLQTLNKNHQHHLQLYWSPLEWTAQNAISHKQARDFVAQIPQIAHDFQLQNHALLNIDTTLYHNAGANDAWELALAMATAVQYLQWAADQKMKMEHIFDHISFSYALTCDTFASLAKLRAHHIIWENILSNFNATWRPNKIFTQTSQRTLCQYDPENNILRNTNAAMVSSWMPADFFFAPPHTPQHNANQQEIIQAMICAQNTLLIAQNESHFQHMVDPAQGTFFIENLTKNMAQKAWKIFQNIQKNGGLAQNLLDQSIHRHIAQQARELKNSVETKKYILTGLTDFPDLKRIKNTPHPHIHKQKEFHNTKPSPHEIFHENWITDHICFNHDNPFKPIKIYQKIEQVCWMLAHAQTIEITFLGQNIKKAQNIFKGLPFNIEPFPNQSNIYQHACSVDALIIEEKNNQNHHIIDHFHGQNKPVLAFEDVPGCLKIGPHENWVNIMETLTKSIQKLAKQDG